MKQDASVYHQLIAEAKKARKYAYAPYSGYQVGAALLAQNGNVYLGCNIENAAYGPSNCAERTAFFKAVSEGVLEFEAIAIVGGKKDGPLDYAYPCGVCRQVMREFTNPEKFVIVVGNDETDYSVHTLAQLLPEAFGPSNVL